MTDKLRALPLAIAALLLNSCAGLAQRAEVDAGTGARRGTVAQFYTPATPAEDLSACLATMSKKELGTRHFVRVEYKHVRHLFSTVAEVADPTTLNIGEPVEIWLDDCEHGRFGRIGRRLASGASD